MFCWVWGVCDAPACNQEVHTRECLHIVTCACTGHLGIVGLGSVNL